MSYQLLPTALRALGMVCLCAPLLLAQTNRGGIAGTIFDPSGAVVPGAIVKVTNIGTNHTVTLTASAEGRYSAGLLEPVNYRITVEAPGFRTAVVEPVKVDTSSMLTANVTLQPSGVTTQVTVTAEAAILSAESGTVSQTVSERQITDIPLAERSVLNLVQTVPNVSGDVLSETPDIGTGTLSPGAGISVNGGRPGSGGFLADGANNTAPSIGRTVVSFSPDVVQEFTVQSSAFSAEYGQTGGGIINITTKSGTNQFHGSLYFFQRNPSLNAAPYTMATTNRPYSNRRQTQVGATIGGPVRLPKIYNGRDKTFFFLAFEPQRITDSTSIFDLAPTEAMRRGDFSNMVPVAGGYTTADIARQFNVPVTGDGTIYQIFSQVGNQLQRLPTPPSGSTFQPFAGNIIPQQWMDPTALKLLPYLPPAGPYFINQNGTLSNWAGQRTVKSADNRFTARVDENLTASNRMSFRLTHVPINGYRGGANFKVGSSEMNALISDLSTSNQLLLSDTHILSPRMMNDLRINYTRGNFSRVNPPEWQNRNLATELGLPSITQAALPYFYFGQSWAYIGQQNITSLADEVDETFNLADTVSRTRGNMTLKFGADLRHSRMKTMPYGLAAGGQYTFSTRETSSLAGGAGGSTFASFLLGTPEQVQFRNSIIPYYYRWATAAGFFQDDWKVRPNLTLNLGMRYSLDVPRWEKFNRQGVFQPDLAQTVALATPIKLPTGQTLTAALVPPFAFSGKGGRSRYLMPIDRHAWEPRFGFAWVPGWDRLHKRLVVRGGYGISHSPLTGQGGNPNPDFSGPVQAFTFLNNNGQANPNYAMRLSSNPPVLVGLTPDQVIKIPDDGLVATNSLAMSGFVVSPNNTVPYVQNWNLTLAWQLGHKVTLETAYVGSKGTHLFSPPLNLNVWPSALSDAYINAGLDPSTTVSDPLGRRNQSNAVIAVPNGSLGAKYLGFNNLMSYLDSSSNSIRHAGYAYLVRRMDRGLYFTATYTYAKSIDDASDAGASYNFTGRADGQSRFGAPRKLDRAVSFFDIRHQIAGTLLWDLPIGFRGKIWSNPPRLLRQVIGGWTLSGTPRLTGSYPFQSYIGDNNSLDQGASSGAIRNNVVPGVPLLNPLYDPKCPIGPTCQPYVNPAAFARPPRGELGNGPRTYDGIRGPMKKYLDLSVQKNFYPFGREGSKRLQFRIDAVNVFNHPNHVFSSNVQGESTRGSKNPSSATITAAEYNLWAAYNNKPLQSTTAGNALYVQIQGIVIQNRLPGGSNLPADFFSIPVPQGFTQMNPNSFDITTMTGYKLYRLCQTWDTRFGALNQSGEKPRLIQFSLKFFF